jgi:hypothetical protein
MQVEAKASKPVLKRPVTAIACVPVKGFHPNC